jgi:hypothetical protein
MVALVQHQVRQVAQDPSRVTGLAHPQAVEQAVAWPQAAMCRRMVEQVETQTGSMDSGRQRVALRVVPYRLVQTRQRKVIAWRRGKVEQAVEVEQAVRQPQDKLAQQGCSPVVEVEAVEPA